MTTDTGIRPVSTPRVAPRRDAPWAGVAGIATAAVTLATAEIVSLLLGVTGLIMMRSDNSDSSGAKND